MSSEDGDRHWRRESVAFWWRQWGSILGMALFYSVPLTAGSLWIHGLTKDIHVFRERGIGLSDILFSPLDGYVGFLLFPLVLLYAFRRRWWTAAVSFGAMVGWAVYCYVTVGLY